jgi:glycosyltransferase involved in cell wall biosynthesis
MIHEKYPEQFPSSKRITEDIKRSVLQADHVICISESTRNDLIDIVGVSPEKVSVVYLGHSLQKALHSDRNISISYPFILYVGKRDGYKNFDSLLQAYMISRTIYMNYKLVCFGGGKFSSKENEKIGAFPVQKKNIIHLDGDDAVLGYLYSKADLFVYPSLYEGFGIPLLEAMSHGVPVVCSNTSSLPEVVGDSAEIVDPCEVDAIAKAMGNVLESSKRRKELIQLGYERIKRFTWDNCAADTYSIYRALV